MKISIYSDTGNIVCKNAINNTIDKFTGSHNKEIGRSDTALSKVSIPPNTKTCEIMNNRKT